MLVKTNKKSADFKLSRYFGYFLFINFVFLMCFAVVNKAQAVDGLMNGKMITGETDDYLFWLQTYDVNTSPYFFDRFFINKSGNVGIGTSSPNDLLTVVGDNPRITSKRSSSSGNSVSFLAASDSLSYPRAAFLIGDSSGDGIANAGLTIAPDVSASVQKPAFIEVKTNLINSVNEFRTILRQSTSLSELYTSSNAGNTAGTNLSIYTYGNAGQVYLKNNGNVGIGLTNPTQKLQVAGALQLDSVSFGVTPGSSQSLALSTVEYVNSMVSGASTSTVGFWSASGNNIFNTNSGNIGIGTTNPAQKLDLQNGILNVSRNNNSSVTNINIQSGSTPVSAFQINTDYNNLTASLVSRSSHSLIFGTEDAERVRITSGGNVGIGTSNPGAKLSIVGNNGVAAADAPLALNVVGGYGSWNEVQGWRGGGINLFGGQGGSTMGVGGNGGIINLIGGNGGTGAFMGNGGNVTISGGVGFYGGNVILNGGSGTTGSGNVILANTQGNVGIGLTNPTQKLQVAGALQLDSVSFGVTPGSSQSLALSTVEYVNSMVSGASTSTVGFWSASGNNIFNTNSGNIGIGITNPEGRLHVLTTAGTVSFYENVSDGAGGAAQAYRKARGTTSSKQAILNNDIMGGLVAQGYTGDAYSTAASIRLIADGNFSSASTPGKIVFQTREANTGLGAPIDRLVISNSGNVGIGTTNPSQSLHVENNVFTQVLIKGSETTRAAELLLLNSDNKGLNINVTGPTYASGAVNDVRLSPSGSGMANISIGASRGSGIPTFTANVSSGNVGIGLTNPTQKLQVAGALQLDSVSFGVTPGSSQSLALSTVEYVNSMVSGASTSTVGFWSASGNNIFNTNSGNIGIGTSDPGAYKLKVVGDVAITGVLQTQTGSDFAEEFSVRAPLPTGTVVIMDNLGHKSVRASVSAYDSKVVGIVSDDPSIIAGRVDSEHKVVVAMMGVVSVNVTGVNGSIQKGDLLTTSNLMGYAMKATENRPGTVIGKALEDFNGQKGRIKVLVNLQ